MSPEPGAEYQVAQDGPVVHTDRGRGHFITVDKQLLRVKFRDDRREHSSWPTVVGWVTTLFGNIGAIFSIWRPGHPSADAGMGLFTGFFICVGAYCLLMLGRTIYLAWVRRSEDAVVEEIVKESAAEGVAELRRPPNENGSS